MKLHVGTSGYAYKEWKGAFYPKDLPADQMLNYYAQRFRAVEINNTFYHMPATTVLEEWKSQVPKDFKFVLKSPRKITHMKRLKNVKEPTRQFLETAAALERHLAPLLFQLPPNMKKDLSRLRDFLALLPKKSRAAFEFRHQSWFEEEVFALLRAHRVALCIADAEDDLKTPFVATANWGYLRLRRPDYGTKELKAWIKQLQKQNWREAFVFFKHEDEANGPRFATKFMDLAK